MWTWGTGFASLCVKDKGHKEEHRLGRRAKGYASDWKKM